MHKQHDTHLFQLCDETLMRRAKTKTCLLVQRPACVENRWLRRKKQNTLTHTIAHDRSEGDAKFEATLEATDLARRQYM